MGDRTNYFVHVKGVRAADRSAITDIICQGHDNDYGAGWDTHPDDHALFSGTFGFTDSSAGTVAEVYSELRDFMAGDPDDESRGYITGTDSKPVGRAAYDFAVLGYQDPFYDAAGWLFCYTPGVGEVVDADCDADGNLTITALRAGSADQLRRFMADAAVVEAFDTWQPGDPTTAAAEDTGVWRTTFTVEVFSHGRFGTEDLRTIAHEIDQGECIGLVTRAHDMRVPPEALRGEMTRIGNDGTFFDDDPALVEGDGSGAEA